MRAAEGVGVVGEPLLRREEGAEVGDGFRGGLGDAVVDGLVLAAGVLDGEARAAPGAGGRGDGVFDAAGEGGRGAEGEGAGGGGGDGGDGGVGVQEEAADDVGGEDVAGDADGEGRVGGLYGFFDGRDGVGEREAQADGDVGAGLEDGGGGLVPRVDALPLVFGPGFGVDLPFVVALVGLGLVVERIDALFGEEPPGLEFGGVGQRGDDEVGPGSGQAGGLDVAGMESNIGVQQHAVVACLNGCASGEDVVEFDGEAKAADFDGPVSDIGQGEFESKVAVNVNPSPGHVQGGTRVWQGCFQIRGCKSPIGRGVRDWGSLGCTVAIPPGSCGSRAVAEGQIAGVVVSISVSGVKDVGG